MTRIGVIGGGNIGETIEWAWERARHGQALGGRLWLTLVLRQGHPRRTAFRRLTG
jgi:hypothetical protein